MKLIVPINVVGDLGVVKDMPAHALPLNAWSDAKNFRFRNGYAERFQGHSSPFDTPTVGPYYLTPAQVGVGYIWLYASLAKIFAYDGTTHTNLTRAVGGDYTATAEFNWTDAVLGGVPILNSHTSVPQMWLPVSLAQPFQPLTSWPVTATCRSLRAFKQFLVAVDVTKSGTRFPHMVKWSHPADPGTVPSSWDETDPTKDAGETSLSETSDFVLDCARLRDLNVIYKENTTWGMQFVGGIEIFRFYKIFDSIGALSRRCAVEFFSGLQAVFGDSDIIRHDGNTAESLITNTLRKWLYARIDPTNYMKSFTAVNFAGDEVWFCFPESGQSLPNMAVVWNFKHNTLGVRDIPLAAHIASGVSNAGAPSDAWSADSNPWSSDTTLWETRLFQASLRGLFMAVPGTQDIFKADDTAQFDGSNYNAFVERVGLGIPLRADRPPDTSQMKFMTRLWPRIEGTGGSVVNIYVAGQENLVDPVVYGPPTAFTIGTDKYIDVRVRGRTFAIKYEANVAADVKLHGYDLEIRKAGLH